MWSVPLQIQKVVTTFREIGDEDFMSESKGTRAWNKTAMQTLLPKKGRKCALRKAFVLYLAACVLSEDSYAHSPVSYVAFLSADDTRKKKKKNEQDGRSGWVDVSMIDVFSGHLNNTSLMVRFKYLFTIPIGLSV